MKKRTATRLGTVLVCLACVCLGAVLALVWQGRQSVLPAAPQISAAPLPAATPEPTPMPPLRRSRRRRPRRAATRLWSKTTDCPRISCM